MAGDWYCEIDGVQGGPFTSVQLRQLAVAGKLRPSHPVWKEGMQKRVPAQTVKGLFDGLPASGATPGKRLASAAPKKDEVEELVEFELVEDFVEAEAVDLELVDKKPTKSARKKEREEVEAAPEILAEVRVTYREGFPDLEGPISGMLCVESKGLSFLFEEGDEDDEVFVSFEKVENVLEPTKGDFPEAMKRKAMGAKIGGTAGRLASGLIGGLIGGSAGKAVSSLGKEASKMASEGGQLGKPPRNRIAVVATIRKERCKLLFDVEGADRNEMIEEARVLFKKIQKARKKSSAPKEDEGLLDVEAMVEEVAMETKASSVRSVSAAPQHSPGAGKPFRVMSAGRTRGPFTVDELRELIDSGKVGDGDLIGVETWVPVSTLAGFFARTSVSVTEEEEVFEDFEHVEDESEEEAPVVHRDEGSIPVDDEFQID